MIKMRPTICSVFSSEFIDASLVLFTHPNRQESDLEERQIY